MVKVGADADMPPADPFGDVVDMIDVVRKGRLCFWPNLSSDSTSRFAPDRVAMRRTVSSPGISFK